MGKDERILRGEKEELRNTSLMQEEDESKPWSRALDLTVYDNAASQKKEEVELKWCRFTEFTNARTKFTRVPCVYVQTDKEMKPFRIGRATKGLRNRYMRATGYTLAAAMTNSGNSLFVAPVEASMCEDVEWELIWRERATLRYNNAKITPPERRLLLRHQGETPTSQPPRPECPICGSDNTIPILYGEPDGSRQLLEALRRGEIELGGCCILPNMPTDRCKSCDQYFGQLKMS